MTTLTIGKVAKAAGLGVETVRFYERQGLIAEPARSDSGYRQYGPETIRRLQFIVRAKALGFTLQEIGDLLDLRATPGAGCADVQARAEAKIADIEERITQLDGVPNLNPATLTERSHAEYKEASDLVEMIKEDLVAERIAVHTYSEVIRWLGDGDPTTRRMMEGILAQEEEHADDMAGLLEKFSKQRR